MPGILAGNLQATELPALPDRPNILCIVCEDISPYLGCYGDPAAVSPHLDRFSEEAIRYTGMYTTIGVSSPSRAALITGMYPTAIGANHMRTAQRKSKPEGITPYEVIPPAGVKCFTEYMRAAGYYCTNNSKTDYQFEVPLTAWDEQGEAAHWQHAPADMPFFSVFNLNVTHEFQVMQRASQPLEVDPADIVLPPYYPDDPVIRRDMAIMYSNIAEMDRQFRSLLDELEASGRTDHTIVIWYSDNGGPLPRQKRELYESGALVPFMIRFPDRREAGTVEEDLHMFTDIPATLLSLAGIPVPDYMHGEVFLGDYTSKPRDYVYGARDRLDTFYEKQACVRDRRYRYIRNYKTGQADYLPIVSRSQMPLMKRLVEMYETGELNADQEKWFAAPRLPEELYDVWNDPHELNNLAGDTRYRSKLTELSRELNRWLEPQREMWELSENDLIRLFRPNGMQPVVEPPVIQIHSGMATLSCATEGASIAYQINGKGLKEKHWWLYTGPFPVGEDDRITAIGVRAGYRNSSLHAEATELLEEWTETLLTYQIDHPNPSLNGGLLCPACARIHGRCGDAVLPLMYMYERSCNPKYLNAAQRLMKWMENVRQPDGSWMNDVHVSDWNGTTVFSAIALYEALHHHGYLLDDSTRTVWRQQLLQAGEFMLGNDFIYSRRREGMRNMNVNYSASATYALYAIGQEFDRINMKERARLIAGDLRHWFTEKEHFLFGEGPEVSQKTPNGCLPVDLMYNVEESLPHLVSYARIAGDSAMLDLVEPSMQTHLHFMLPDGAWDNSWGTRSFKWAYWGGRTSDGCLGGYYALAGKYPEFAEACRRNLSLLRRATVNGLLHGGMHYADWGTEACIHHTFGHAKAVTTLLNQPVVMEPPVWLPREKARGVTLFGDIRTWLIAEGPWRATVTGFDAEYKVKGTHPMGGVLSLLWHEQVGPLFAATMNAYSLIEAPNMQSCYDPDLMPGSPRVELIREGVRYSNLDDRDARITYTSDNQEHRFNVSAHLVNIYQETSGNEHTSVEIGYTFTPNKIICRARIPEELRKAGARMVLPVIASTQEKELLTAHRMVIEKKGGKVYIESPNEWYIASSTGNRIFNPVPGFCFIPLVIEPGRDGEIHVEMYIR
ncbi:MAG: sulfatase-like hydrolase/transferase [Bacteroides sp.]|nr:sulfatase-like hydrolase/transferase [Bacteroides sp.]